MRPSNQFITTIGMLYQKMQTTISNQDLIKHRYNETAFYSMSLIVTRNGYIIKQTEPFSDRMIIELDKGCDTMFFISEEETTRFRRISELELSVINGVTVLHWNAQSERGQVYVVVKLMSPDGCVQIKLITSDQITQMVHNVCELPAHFVPNF